MKVKRGCKIRGWLSAGFALALGLCLSTGKTPAQSSAMSASPAGKQTASAKTPNSKTPARASTASAAHASRSHSQPASHAATVSHSKSNAHSASHSGKTKYASSRKNGKRRTTARGQQKIDPDRAQEIQEALIREHYLAGAASGTWNQSCEDAMRRYQADHGWQSKTVPDARALISLGLGPNHEHLLNPESAMTTEPPQTHAASLAPVSHSSGVAPTTPPASLAAPGPAAVPAHNGSIPQ